mmetsp:Transcript_52270/g.122371  ORF Transcript_52270/g.122371 Transcript_52270/m.122371 type:complete len:200 (+) Transcript_52270:1856-2455(+)
MRCASPSATAVLPTPGGPTRHALFFFLRSKIWMTRSISSSRPKTGSNNPSNAICVRSTPTSLSFSFLSPPPPPTVANSFCASEFPAAALNLVWPIASSTADLKSSLATPSSPNTLTARLSAKAGLVNPSSMCSQPTSTPFTSALTVSNNNLVSSAKGSDGPRLPLLALSKVIVSKMRLSASRVTPFWESAALAMRFPAC